MEHFIAGMRNLIANPQLGVKTKYPELRIKICKALIEWAIDNPDADILMTVIDVFINDKRYYIGDIYFPATCIISLESTLCRSKVESVRIQTSI